ncbi:MAG: ThuA domain-containing protein, partial [Planctomycetes bacterium]|nr:ThuA domain-containing protein [Planctomycetota bacterium]
MKKRIFCLWVVSLFFGAVPAAAQSGESGWISLFDGKSLSGWRASENKDTFSVRDGMIVVAGPRSHLFYVGPVKNAMFKDFELKIDVMTRPGSNAGIYLHTQYQETGWPGKGYEVQVNNTHKDWRKTGSLYAIEDVRESPAVDDKWFTEHIIVRGKRIIIKVEDEVMVDYREPAGLDRPERQLSSGTFALQGHDPKSVVFFKNIRVKPLGGVISFEAVKADQLERIEKALPSRPVVKPAKPRKLLVFSLAKGFKHRSIPHGAKTFELMGKKSGAFKVVHSSEMSAFDWDHLKRFDAVLFNNTTRLTFDDPARRKSLMRFVKEGKGVIGIHSATDNFYNWPEAARMMGGQFWGHPWHEKVTLKIEDPDHPCAKSFGGSSYEITDEIYQFRNESYSRERLRILASIDPAGTDMNKEKIKRIDGDFAVSWVQSFGKGRVFYSSLGHREEIFWNPVILQHYLAGIQFAMGDLKADTTPSGPKPVKTSAELKGLNELLGKIKSYEYGQSRISLTELSDLTRKTYGSHHLMRVIEHRLLEFLRSNATLASKQFVCRELSVIGTEASAPTLGGMLSESSTSDMARYALERIEGKAVGSVLRDALGQTSGKVRVGIVSTLGMRRDTKSAAALGRLIYSSDRMLAKAAVSALGRIGNEKAAGFLRKASMELSGTLQPEIMDAYLQCADQVAKRGEKSKAKGMYNTIYRLDEAPRMIHVAAFKGLAGVSGSESVKLVVDAIQSDDRMLQGVAIGLVRSIPGPDI